jgi:ribosomal protein L27
MGKDFTLFAMKDWIVSFKEKRKVKFDWRIFRDTYVSVL